MCVFSLLIPYFRFAVSFICRSDYLCSFTSFSSLLDHVFRDIALGTGILCPRFKADLSVTIQWMERRATKLNHRVSRHLTKCLFIEFLLLVSSTSPHVAHHVEELTPTNLRRSCDTAHHPVISEHEIESRMSCRVRYVRQGVKGYHLAILR